MAAIAARPGFRIPLLKSFSGFRPAGLGPDIVAGVTLAAVAIPEQMATARLAGLPPQLGFFAFIAATLAFALFGSSRQVSTGADSTIAPIFAGGLALLAAAGSPHYLALAALLGLMVGVLVTAAGALRMGWVGNLLSIPVTTGFLAGIAVHIIVSQAPAAMGVPAPSGPTALRIVELFAAAPHANLYTLAIAGGVVALIAGGHAISARIPGPLIAVALAAAAVGLWRLDRHGVELLGAVGGGLPVPALPSAGLDDVIALLPLASMVALVVMVQTAATARSFPPDGGPPDVDGDFVGLGAGNILSGLLGGFPVNASPPRTAIVAESGGRSQVSGLTAVAITLALLFAGMGLLSHIPHAALAGVLLFVALRIIRVGQMRDILRRRPAEALLVLVTIAGLVLLPIQDGVAIGVLLSLLHGVWCNARTQLLPLKRVPGTTVWWPIVDGAAEGETLPGVLVLGFPAPLNFLNADSFAHQFRACLAAAESPVRLAVLEAAGMIDVDFTAAQAVRAAIADCRAAGAAFALARMESVAAQTAITALGLRADIGEDHIFPSVDAAIRALYAPEER